MEKNNWSLEFGYIVSGYQDVKTTTMNLLI